MRSIVSASAVFCVAAALVATAYPQGEPELLAPVLNEEVVSPQVSLFQLRQYILSQVGGVPATSSAEQWTAESRRLREEMLGIVFHGWPREWVSAPPAFEDLGLLESGKGYRIRKLRYEIVPGFKSAALLYEPENPAGKVPGIVNVNGHVGAPGKSVEYKQKRCVTFARNGIMALNLEWLSFGELSSPENQHWYGAHLDLVGVHEAGLFVLAMRKGLDYLYSHPMVDRNRLGVTGLSGGGWQTIVLSSLDERVKASVPVAGFSSIRTRVEARAFGDLGDVEQSATDLFAGRDYTHLVGLMAPRPMLLIYNAEDDCCFRAPLVRPLVYDAMRPLYRLYGREDALQWHENRDPGTHNYQLDNRLQAYRFFSRVFNLPPIEGEAGVDGEIKSYDELVVGLPGDNLTILGLARRLAASIVRSPVPSAVDAKVSWAAAERKKLTEVVRYKPVTLQTRWTVANTKSRELETESCIFHMSNGLSANAVWTKAIRTAGNAPATLIINDKGKKASAAPACERVNRGEQVLAADLVFMGDAWRGFDVPGFQEVLHGNGDRPLGLEAAQLLELARLMRARSGGAKVRLESSGMRSQVAAVIAAALSPGLFSEVVVHDGIESLGYLLQKPVEFQQGAELFCLDLYKEFDLDRLALIAEPSRVIVPPKASSEIAAVR